MNHRNSWSPPIHGFESAHAGNSTSLGCGALKVWCGDGGGGHDDRSMARSGSLRPIEETLAWLMVRSGSLRSPSVHQCFRYAKGEIYLVLIPFVLTFLLMKRLGSIKTTAQPAT